MEIGSALKTQSAYNMQDADHIFFSERNKKLQPSNNDDIPPSVQKSINNIIRKEGYMNYYVIKRTISTEGANFLGILSEIDIKGYTKEGNTETNLFVKQIIPDTKLKILSMEECYNKESYFYNELLVIYDDLQVAAGVPETNRFKAVKSFGESNSELIILENLSKKGFKTLHRMEVVPLKFAELSIKQLAKFHGLSMVLQNRRPEYFDEKVKVLKPPYELNTDFGIHVNKMFDLFLEALNEDSKKVVAMLREQLLEKFRKFFDTSGKTCCISHGDYRESNILYKELDGEIHEVVPIDYQLMHYGSPINDFIYFIFVGTDREFRKNHMENLKNLYYKTLTQFLVYFDMDLSILFPRQEFEKLYKESLEYGLTQCCFALPFEFVMKCNAPDFGKVDLINTKFKLDVRYKERVQGIVDDFIEWGYIKNSVNL